MNTIKRDVYVLRNTIKIPIEVTKGTDAISFEFTVRDYNLPATAGAVAYAYHKSMKKPNSALCDVSGNVISFQPSANFFEVGMNELQIRVINEGKSLISFKEKVKCSDSMGFPDEEEEEKQQTLVEQLVSYSGKETGERKAADEAEKQERIAVINTEKAERIAGDAQEKSERQAEIATERARINQFTKLAAGSTTGDAELIDGRMDVDGNVHDNIGDAMRGQTRKLRENLVVRQKEQPTDPNNNVWISDEDDEVEVPDMGEFNFLKEDIDDLTVREVYFEELHPEWLNGYVGSNGQTITESEKYNYCTIDVYEQDVLLIKFMRFVCAYNANGYAVEEYGMDSNSPINIEYTVPKGIKRITITTVIGSKVYKRKYKPFIKEGVVKGVEISGNKCTLIDESNKNSVNYPSNIAVINYIDSTVFIKTKNVFDKDINMTNGYISPSNGIISESETIHTTDYITVNGGKNLTCSVNEALFKMRFVAQFDENEKIISKRDSDYSNLKTCVLDEKTCSVRISFLKTVDLSKVMITNNDSSEPSIYEPFEKFFNPKYVHENTNESKTKSPFYGKKVAWVGSSITQGYKWCDIVNSYFDFSATNCGVGGTAMCYESDSSMCTKERLLGQYSNVTDPNTGEITYNGVAIPSDVDIIFIEAGTNDWARNWDIGDKQLTFSDSKMIFDRAKFCGASHNFFSNCRELFPNAIVIAIGAPYCKYPNRGSFTDKYGIINNKGFMSLDYGDVLAEIAHKWGYIGFNFGNEASVNDMNVMEMGDGLHITTDLYAKKVANVIINHLLEIKNPII